MNIQRCPVCKSTDIEEQSAIVVSELEFCAVCFCNDCMTEFHQLYKLQRIDIPEGWTK